MVGTGPEIGSVSAEIFLDPDPLDHDKWTLLLQEILVFSALKVGLLDEWFFEH